MKNLIHKYLLSWFKSQKKICLKLSKWILNKTRTEYGIQSIKDRFEIEERNDKGKTITGLEELEFTKCYKFPNLAIKLIIFIYKNTENNISFGLNGMEHIIPRSEKLKFLLREDLTIN